MKKWGLLLLLLAATGVYFTYSPTHNGWFPKCPFLSLTGLKCPGCGSQRAIHSLLHFRMGDAFGYNALLVMSIPAVVVLVFAEWKRTQMPAFYRRLNSPATTLICLFVVLLWAVVRNVFGW